MSRVEVDGDKVEPRNSVFQFKGLVKNIDNNRVKSYCQDTKNYKAVSGN